MWGKSYKDQYLALYNDQKLELMKDIYKRWYQGRVTVNYQAGQKEQMITDFLKPIQQALQRIKDEDMGRRLKVFKAIAAFSDYAESIEDRDNSKHEALYNALKTCTSTIKVFRKSSSYSSDLEAMLRFSELCKVFLSERNALMVSIFKQALMLPSHEQSSGTSWGGKNGVDTHTKSQSDKKILTNQPASTLKKSPSDGSTDKEPFSDTGSENPSESEPSDAVSEPSEIATIINHTHEHDGYHYLKSKPNQDGVTFKIDSQHAQNSYSCRFSSVTVNPFEDNESLSIHQKDMMSTIGTHDLQSILVQAAQGEQDANSNLKGFLGVVNKFTNAWTGLNKKSPDFYDNLVLGRSFFSQGNDLIRTLYHELMLVLDLKEQSDKEKICKLLHNAMNQLEASFKQPTQCTSTQTTKAYKQAWFWPCGYTQASKRADSARGLGGQAKYPRVAQAWINALQENETWPCFASRSGLLQVQMAHKQVVLWSYIVPWFLSLTPKFQYLDKHLIARGLGYWGLCSWWNLGRVWWPNSRDIEAYYGHKYWGGEILAPVRGLTVTFVTCQIPLMILESLLALFENQTQHQTLWHLGKELGSVVEIQSNKSNPQLCVSDPDYKTITEGKKEYTAHSLADCRHHFNTDFEEFPEEFKQFFTNDAAFKDKNAYYNRPRFFNDFTTADNGGPVNVTALMTTLINAINQRFSNCVKNQNELPRNVTLGFFAVPPDQTQQLEDQTKPRQSIKTLIPLTGRKGLQCYPVTWESVTGVQHKLVLSVAKTIVAIHKYQKQCQHDFEDENPKAAKNFKDDLNTAMHEVKTSADVLGALKAKAFTRSLFMEQQVQGSASNHSHGNR